MRRRRRLRGRADLACRSGCTATLLRPDGEGSGCPIVRTAYAASACCGVRRGVARPRMGDWPHGDSCSLTLAEADLAALVAEWLDWAARPPSGSA